MDHSAELSKASDGSQSVQQNLSAWKNLTRHRHRLTLAARDEDFANPLASVDGPGWLGGDIRGQRVLCLAAGGGRQGPLYAAAGAEVTVVDFCQELLDQDLEVAKERKLHLQVLRASMTDLSALADQTFGIVIHPVSTCYVADLSLVFAEVARVIRPGGLYISQHKQPASLQADLEPCADGSWRILASAYRRTPLPQATVDSLIREPFTDEFIHSWQSLVGGICRAGFVVEDLTEPMHADAAAEPGSFAHRCQYFPPYVRIKARRLGNCSRPERRSALWMPDTDSGPARTKQELGD